MRRFLQRFAALSPAEWAAAARAYDALQVTRPFGAADRALADAIDNAGRERERDAVVGPLVQLVRVPDAPPVPDDAPPPLDPVAEAALAALLALVARDLLDEPAFRTLYAPFETLVPLATLDV